MKAVRRLLLLVLVLAGPYSAMAEEEDGPRFVNPTREQIREWFVIVEQREPTPFDIGRVKTFFRENPLPPQEDLSARKQAIGKFFGQMFQRQPRLDEAAKTLGFLEVQQVVKELRILKGEVQKALSSLDKNIAPKEGPVSPKANSKGAPNSGQRRENAPGGGDGSSDPATPATNQSGDAPAPTARRGHGGIIVPELPDLDNASASKSPTALPSPISEKDAIREALEAQVRSGALSTNEADALLQSVDKSGDDASSLSPERIASAAFETLRAPLKSTAPTAPSENLLRGLDQLQTPSAAPVAPVSKSALKTIPETAAVPTTPPSVLTTFAVLNPPLLPGAPDLFPWNAVGGSPDKKQTKRPSVSGGTSSGAASITTTVATGTGMDISPAAKPASPPATLGGLITKRATDFVKKLAAVFGGLRTGARMPAFQGPDGVSVLTRGTVVPGAPTPVPFAAIAAAEAEAKARAVLISVAAASNGDDTAPWDGIDWAFAAAILLTLGRILWVLQRWLRRSLA